MLLPPISYKHFNFVSYKNTMIHLHLTLIKLYLNQPKKILEFCLSFFYVESKPHILRQICGNNRHRRVKLKNQKSKKRCYISEL